MIQIHEVSKNSKNCITLNGVGEIIMIFCVSYKYGCWSFLIFFSFQVSITFDPFLYLPVPLPQKQKVLTVFYFAKDPHKKPVKVHSTTF